MSSRVGLDRLAQERAAVDASTRNKRKRISEASRNNCVRVCASIRVPDISVDRRQLKLAKDVDDAYDRRYCGIGNLRPCAAGCNSHSFGCSDSYNQYRSNLSK